MGKFFRFTLNETKNGVIKERKDNNCKNFFFNKELYPLSKIDSNIDSGYIITSFSIKNEPEYILSIELNIESGHLEKVRLFVINRISYFSNIGYISEKEEIDAKKSEEIYAKCKEEIIKNIDNLDEFSCKNRNKENITLEDVIYAYVLMLF